MKTAVFTIEIELCEFARFKARHEGLRGAEGYIARVLAKAMDAEIARAGGTVVIDRAGGKRSMPEPAGDSAAEDGEESYSAQDLARGSVDVAASVRADHEAHAEKHFREGGFFSAEDYLQGVLNAALMEAMAAYDDRHVSGPGDNWRPGWLRRRLAVGDGPDDDAALDAESVDADGDIPF